MTGVPVKGHGDFRLGRLHGAEVPASATRGSTDTCTLASRGPGSRRAVEGGTVEDDVAGACPRLPVIDFPLERPGHRSVRVLNLPEPPVGACPQPPVCVLNLRSQPPLSTSAPRVRGELSRAGRSKTTWPVRVLEFSNSSLPSSDSCRRRSEVGGGTRGEASGSVLPGEPSPEDRRAAAGRPSSAAKEPVGDRRSPAGS